MTRWYRGLGPTQKVFATLMVSISLGTLPFYGVGFWLLTSRAQGSGLAQPTVTPTVPSPTLSSPARTRVPASATASLTSSPLPTPSAEPTTVPEPTATPTPQPTVPSSPTPAPPTATSTQTPTPAATRVPATATRPTPAPTPRASPTATRATTRSPTLRGASSRRGGRRVAKTGLDEGAPTQRRADR